MKVVRKAKPEFYSLSASFLADRRQYAARLLADGKHPAAVAREVGVHRNVAAQWKRRLDAGESLGATPKTGRPGRVSKAQIAELIEGGAKKPKALSEAGLERYGVRYSVDYCGVLLRGWRQATPAPQSAPAPAERGE